MKPKFIATLNLVLLTFLNSCSEESPECQGILKSRPLVQIQNCIEGNWKFLYSIGGITGQMRIDYENSFIDFQKNNTVFWVKEGAVPSEEVVEWSYIEDQFNESTYVMTGAVGPWGFQEIKQDTLFIYDVGNDGFVHVLKKD